MLFSLRYFSHNGVKDRLILIHNISRIFFPNFQVFVEILLGYMWYAKEVLVLQLDNLGLNHDIALLRSL